MAHTRGRLRVLGIGDSGDLGDLYAHLQRYGHEVRMAVEDPAYHDVFRGLVEHTADWRKELAWIREAGRDGIILFETAHHGALQDELRRDGFQVIGGCAFGDRLEGERELGQAVLHQAGLQTAATWCFRDLDAGIAYIRARPRRYVVKHNGHHLPSTRTHVGTFADGGDVIALLQEHARQGVEGADFVLMDAVDGVETGVGAYFDGRRFVGPVCLDWEHKRFFPGDLGELTGEMGTVVTYEGGGRLFADTLAHLAPVLAEHGYCGYINLNTIINEEGVWPLEFTCRFGYPGFAILAALHRDGWEGLLRLLCGQPARVLTHPGFAVGVVVTVPPFPYLATPHPSRGLPIRFQGGLSADDLDHVHFGEVDFSSGEPVVGGVSGYVLVITGRGPDVSSARREAYRLLGRTQIPNARYRHDIGCRYIERDAALLAKYGYSAVAAASASASASMLVTSANHAR